MELGKEKARSALHLSEQYEVNKGPLVPSESLNHYTYVYVKTMQVYWYLPSAYAVGS